MVKGFIKGQCIITLVDGGAIHNLIDATLVAKKGLPTKEFEGLDVIVVVNFSLF